MKIDKVILIPLGSCFYFSNHSFKTWNTIKYIHSFFLSFFLLFIHSFIHSFILSFFLLSIHWIDLLFKLHLTRGTPWTEMRIQSICREKLKMGLNFSIIYGLFQALPLNLLSVMVEYRSITLLLYRPGSRAPKETILHMCPKRKLRTRTTSPFTIQVRAVFTLIIEISEIKHDCMVRDINNDLCKIFVTVLAGWVVGGASLGRGWGHSVGGDQGGIM